MSEPHELEERVARIICVDCGNDPDQAVIWGPGANPSTKARPRWMAHAETARTVLALVKAEQMKWTMAIHANGIEWWWESHISHTATETSNG